MTQSPKPLAQTAEIIDVLSGIEPIAHNYDAFIFDVWGVIHNGVCAYPGVVRCLSELKARNKQILMLSNSPSRAKYMVAQLQSMGVGTHLFDHVVTSGESTHNALKAYEGQSIYCLGYDNDPNCLHGIQITNVSSPQDADVALICEVARNVTINDYTDTLRQCLDRDLTLICANPDKVVDVGGTLYTCAGAIADHYQDMGGTVHWHGKPYAPVYDWAFELLGQPDKTKVLAVGDSLRTDVTGAVNYGIDVLWNAVGIHWEEISHNNNVNDAKIKQALSGLPSCPTAILNGLAW